MIPSYIPRYYCWLLVFGLIVVTTTAASNSLYASNPFNVFVDPEGGNDDLQNGLIETDNTIVRTVHGARDVVRSILSQHLDANIIVHLLPGIHHIGNSPLTLGPLDGPKAGGMVTWRSADPLNPAIMGAPIKITGWKPHPTVKNAMVAPLPSSITKGSILRHFWVNGTRADKTRGYPGKVNATNWSQNGTLNTTNLPIGGYDFTGSSMDPSKWTNPADVEFVFTGCKAMNCWLEPRCTVDSVRNGRHVILKNPCYHKIFYFGIGWGGKPDGKLPPSPTHLENIDSNLTLPGQFYYDRSGASILYIPRQGEDIATLESTAFTATKEQILVVNGTKNMRWVDVAFHYATWIPGPAGFVDTQAGFLYREGEPPANIRVQTGRNITFSNCDFNHLGAVYGLVIDGASQNVTVSNCTFTDISGGAVKLGDVGERGHHAPDINTPAEKQDAGFLVEDNWIHDIPTEYHGAIPIFAGYVADVILQYNTIERCSYSGISVGWGWGQRSYGRNNSILNNRIIDVMQLLSDGGHVYTNAPFYGSSVSNNYFAGDPTNYGMLYHDAGSGFWTDERNVFNHARTHCVFAHGSEPNTTINYVWYNDTSAPQLQGAAKASNVFELKKGQPWPAEAQKVIDNAGRRTK